MLLAWYLMTEDSPNLHFAGRIKESYFIDNCTEGDSMSSKTVSTVLRIVPNNSLLTDEERIALLPYVERFLGENGAKLVTVEMAFKSPKILADMRSRREADLENQRLESLRVQEEAEAAQAKAMDEELKKLEALLNPPAVKVEKPTLTLAEIEIGKSRSYIPQMVEDMRQSLVGQLPSFVFDKPGFAMAMRGWLCRALKWVKEDLCYRLDISNENIVRVLNGGVTTLINQFDPTERDLAQALVDRYWEISKLIDLLNQVVLAWGYEKNAKSTADEFYIVCGKLDEDPQFSYLDRMPSGSAQPQVETFVDTTVRGERIKTDDQVRREELEQVLFSRLKEVGAGDPSRMSSRLIKKYGDMDNSDEIFVAAAVNALDMALPLPNKEYSKEQLEKMEPQKQAAMLYGEVVGMTYEQLEAAVVSLRQKRDADAAKASAAKQHFGMRGAQAKKNPKDKTAKQQRK